MRPFLCSCILIPIFCFFIEPAFSQVSAVSAKHETDAQTSISITLGGSLSSAYTCVTAGCLSSWTVTIGGVNQTPTSVVGGNGSTTVTANFATPVGIDPVTGKGQTVTVSYSGGGALLNNFTNLASVNNKRIVCTDFSWGGTLIGTPACAPVDPQTRMYFVVNRAARNSSFWNLANATGRVVWSAGNSSVFQTEETDAGGTAVVGNYDYYVGFDAEDATVSPSSPSGNFIYPANEPVCGYTSTWNIRLIYPAAQGDFTNCPITDPNQIVVYASHNDDATGESNDGANTTAQLLLEPSEVNSNQVCVGTNVDMQFSDNTRLNCITTVSPIPTNDDVRWVRVVYGSTDLGGGNTATSNIPNIRVGTTPVTDTDGTLFYPGGYYPVAPATTTFGSPDAFGVVEITSPVASAQGLLEQIITTSEVGQVVGQRFYVRLEYWNSCNPYDLSGDLVAGNARSIENFIEIVEVPDNAVPVDKDFCYNETMSSPAGPAVPGTCQYCFEVDAANVAGSTEIKWYTTLANAEDDVSEINNDYGTNARFLRPTEIVSRVTAGTTGSVPNTAPNSGETYAVWVRYRTTNTEPACLSEPQEVRIVKRPRLDFSTQTITPSAANICRGTAMTFSLPVALTDNPNPQGGYDTRYVWTVPGTWTIDAGQNFKSITATPGTSAASGINAVSAIWEYQTATTSGLRCAINNISANVTVIDAPSIGVQPVNRTICEDASTTFSVSGVTGAAPLTYQWQEDPNTGTFANIINGGPYSNATTATLGINTSGLGTSMSGYRYRVIVTGACGPVATSAERTLNILAKPAISVQPPDRTVCVNGTTTFPVTATGSGVLTYQWQEDPNTGTFTNITNGGPYSNATTATLNVNTSGMGSSMDGYRYRVIVSGSCLPTVTSNPGTLDVQGPIVSISNGASVGTCESNDLALSATETFFGGGVFASRQWTGSYDETGPVGDLPLTVAELDALLTDGLGASRRTALNPIFNSAGLGLSKTGVYTLTLTSTDNLGCSNSATIVINVGQVLADILYDQDGTNDPYTGTDLNANVCSGIDLFIDGNPSGGSGNYSNQTWALIMAPGGATGTLSSTITEKITFNYTTPGVYVLRFSLQDDGGCTFITDAASDLTITVHALPVANDQSPGPLCSDANGGTTVTVDLTALQGAINGGGSITYAWFESYNAGTKVFSNSIATPASYAVTDNLPIYAQVLDGNACISPAEVVYSVNPRPGNPTGGIDVTECSDAIGTATVSVNDPGGALTIDWYDQATGGTLLLADNEVFDPAAAQEPSASNTVTFYAEARNTATGCLSTGRTAVDLTSDSRPTDAAVGADVITCDDDALLDGVAADNGGTGTWSVGTPIYYETFPSIDNGSGITGPAGHATNYSHPSGEWSLTVQANTFPGSVNEWAKVDNGTLSVRNSTNEVVWRSRLVDISTSGNVAISAQATETGTQTAAEYIRLYYSINGGGEILFADITDDLPASDDGVLQTFTVPSVAGNDLRIIMRTRNTASADRHILDNVVITSAGSSVPFIADIHDPASAVSNLQEGANVFTWTVSSALGACAPTTAQMTITRNPQPLTVDIPFQLCETTEGTLVYENYDLTIHNGDVANNELDRTVTWFLNEDLTVPVPDPADVSISDADVFYAHVVNDITSCNNVTPVLNPGSVTFQVLTLPTVTLPPILDRTFCDDVVGGIQSHTGVDLTSYNTQIHPTATVTWYPSSTDAQNLTNQLLGAAATNATVVDGDSYFARVVDGLSCVNFLEVPFVVNPTPATNSITGNTIDCSSSTAVKVYQVDASLNVFGSVHEYNWEVDGAGVAFEVFNGISFITTTNYQVTNSSFLILVRFPNPGAFTLTVSETIDGCTGAVAVLVANISGAPSALTFAQAPEEVCQGETNVTYSLVGGAQAGSNYVWTVVGGTVVGPSTGNIASITVNWGTNTIPQPRVSVTESNSSGCSGAPASVDISLHDNPVMSSPATATICSGSSPSSQLTFEAQLDGSAPLSAITFHWTAVNVPANITGLAESDTGTGQLTDILTNVSGVAGVLTLEVVPVENDLPNPPNCTTDPQTVFITVLPQPVVTPGQTATICSGEAVDYAISLTPAGLPPATKLEWPAPDMSDGSIQGSASIPGGVAQSNAVHITDVLINTSSAPITAIYRITPVDGTCAGVMEDVVITINPEPVGADHTAAEQCSGQPFVGVSADNIQNAVASTFTWVRNVLPTGLSVITAGTGSGNIVETLQNVTSGQLIAVYTVTPLSADGCAGATYEISVPVNPAPLGGNVSRIAECSNVAFSVSSNNITNGLDATSTFTWVRNPLPAGLTEVTAGTGMGDIAEALRNLTSAPLSATYVVTPTSDEGCPGATYVVTVPINPEPAGADITAADQCSNTPFSLSANNITNGLGGVSTYTWVRNILPMGLNEVTAGDGTGNIEETLENLTSGVLNAVYVITPTSGNGCAGESYEISIPINPEPVGADITQVAQCSGDFFNVSPINITNGLGATSSYTWVRNALPTGLTEITAGTGSGNIQEELQNLTSGQLSATYIVTPTSGAGCEGATYVITVPVNPEPTAPALTTIERCSGDPLNFDIQSLINNSVTSKFRYTVAVEAGPASSEINAGGLNRPVASQTNITDVFTHRAVVSTSDAVVVYTITPVSMTGDCEGTPFVLRVLIHPEPRATNEEANTCGQSGSEIDHPLQSQIQNGVNSTFTYIVYNDPTNPLATIDSDRGVASTANITFTYINTTEEEATITYEVTPYSLIVSPLTGMPTMCPGNVFFYEVTVSPQPVGVDLTLDAICSNVPFNIDPQNNVDDGGNDVTITEYDWEADYETGLTVNGAPPDDVETGVSGSTNITGFLTNKTTTQKVAEFHVTPRSGDCEGPEFVIRLPIDPQPVVDSSITPDDVCSDAPTNIVFGPVTNTVTPDNYDVVLVSIDPDLTPDGSNGAVGLGVGNNVIASHRYTNNSRPNPLEVVYSVTPHAPATTAGVCTGDPFNMVINVWPEPVMNSALSSLAVCSGEDSEIELSTDGVSVIGDTYFINSVLLNGTDISGPNMTVGDIVSGNNNVNQNPLTATNDERLLADDAFTLKIDGLPVNEHTIVYNVTPRSPSNPAEALGCLGDPFDINLLIKPEPVLLPGITPFPEVCSNDEINITLAKEPASVDIAQYQFVHVEWDPAMTKGLSNVNVGQTLAGPTAVIEDSYINTTGAERDATYTIVPVSADECLGDPDATTVVTITPAPAVAAGADNIVCSDAVADITVNDTDSEGGFPALSFVFTRPALPPGINPVSSYTPGTTPADNNVPSDVLALDEFINTTDLPIDIAYTVEAWTGLGGTGCTSSHTVVLTVEPVIKVTEVDALQNEICAGTQAEVAFRSETIPTAGNLTYDFTVSGAGSGSNLVSDGDMMTPEIVQQLENNTNVPKVFTYNITPRANSAAAGEGCPGQPVTVDVTVEPKPKLTISPSSLTICEGVPLAVNFSSPTLPSAGASTMYFHLDLFDNPTGEIARDNVSGTDDYTAGTNALNETLINDSEEQQSVAYHFMPSFNISGGRTCTAEDPIVFNVTVSPRPVLHPFAITPQCSGQSFDLDYSSSVTEAELESTLPTWTFSYEGADNMSGASKGAGTDFSQVVFNRNPDPATVKYTFTSKSFNCASNTIDVNVEVYPVPKISDLDPSEEVCNGGTLDAPLVSSASNTKYVWLVDSPSGLSGAVSEMVPQNSISNFTLTNSGESLNSYTFEITPLVMEDPTLPVQTLPDGVTQINGCLGDARTVIVNVAPPLGGAIKTSNESHESFICKGDREFIFMEFNGLPLFKEVVYKEGGNVITLTNQPSFKPIQVTPEQTTVYELVSIKDAYNCPISFTDKVATVHVNDTDATFSIAGPEEACSPHEVSFQYDQQNGVTYTWKWFDGPDEVFTATSDVDDMIINHTFENPSPVGTAKFKVYLETALADPNYEDRGFCSNTSFKEVRVLPNASVNIFPSATEICSGDKVSVVNSSQGVSSHRWYYRQHGTDRIEDGSERTTQFVEYELTNHTTANPIVYDIVYEVNEGGTCPGIGTIEVKVYKGVDASFNADVPDFIAGNARVTFTNTSQPLDASFFDYAWDFDAVNDATSTPSSLEGTQTPIEVDYHKPGIFEVLLIATNKQAKLDGIECVSMAKKTISINLPPLSSSFTVTPLAACYPTTFEITNNSPGADTFEWRVFSEKGEVATSNVAQPVFQINEPGNYTITLVASLSSPPQVAPPAEVSGIEIYGNPIAFFIAPNSSVFVPDTELGLINQSQDANFFEWDFDDGTVTNDFEPQHFYLLEGKYTVTLVAGNDHGDKDIDGDGIGDGNIVCYDTTTAVIIAKEGGFTRIPNAFTPDPGGPNDGSIDSGFERNDVFLPVTKGVVEFNMQVYDRWGTLVFESNDKNVGWNGYNQDGNLLPAGVYVYKLTLRLADGQRTTQVGDVTMIR